MTTETGVSVVGLARLRRDLKTVGAGLEDLKTANAAAGTLVAQAAGGRAPRRTGTLAGTGRAARAAGRASVLFGGARAPYAGPIHWGWPARGIEANPFVLDAALATEPLWLPLYAADLERLAGSLDGRTY